MAKLTYVEPAAYFTPKARKILEEGNKTENEKTTKKTSNKKTSKKEKK